MGIQQVKPVCLKLYMQWITDITMRMWQNVGCCVGKNYTLYTINKVQYVCFS